MEWNKTRYILILSCADTRGIVATVTTFLMSRTGLSSNPPSSAIRRRKSFSCACICDGAGDAAFEKLKKLFADKVGDRFKMEWALHPDNQKPRMLILVSKQLHCLNDVLHRFRTGLLPVEIPA